MQHINEQWNPIKIHVLVESLYSYMLNGVAHTSQNGKFVSLLPLLCHFYDILLLCIRIENNQHLFSFVLYVPHLITCNCTKIQPLSNIFIEFRSSLNVLHILCMCKRMIFLQKRSFVVWSVSVPSDT